MKATSILTSKISIDQTAVGTSDSVTVKAAGAFVKCPTATLTNVAALTTSQTLLASNTARCRVIIVNESVSKLYLKFGATASATSYSIALNAFDTYESPVAGIYTGVIDGVWASAVGAARVTEI